MPVDADKDDNEAAGRDDGSRDDIATLLTDAKDAVDGSRRNDKSINKRSTTN